MLINITTAFKGMLFKIKTNYAYYAYDFKLF